MSEQEQLSKKMNEIANRLLSELVTIMIEENLHAAHTIIMLEKIIEYFLEKLDAEAETEKEKQIIKEFRQKIANDILGNR